MSANAKFLPLAGFAFVSAAAWVYLLTAGMTLVMNVMTIPDGSTMAMPADWTPAYVFRIFIMWAIMMVAMMLPSAMPAAAQLAAASAMLRFAAMYVGPWVLFAFAATLVQWALFAEGLLSDGMAAKNGTAAGVLLITIGLYQFNPRMAGDLERCRNGTGYVVSCLRCCAPLMLLLFVVGIMNFAWWVVLALWVLAEKAVPSGVWLARAGGVALVIWGFTLAIARSG
jgi:predicted metal-binding membrane protein